MGVFVQFFGFEKFSRNKIIKEKSIKVP